MPDTTEDLLSFNRDKQEARIWPRVITYVTAFLLWTVIPVNSEEVAIQDRVIQLNSEHPELETLNLQNPEILEAVLNRQPGLEFYLPALLRFAELSAPQQEGLLQQVSSVFETKDDTLLMELRLPVVLIQAVLAEAQKNGADIDWDIPAFEEALEELRMTGNTGASTFEDIRKFAPSNANLVARQVRLTRSQGRLADAQGRLSDTQAIGDALQGVLGAINDAIESGNEVLNQSE